MGGKGEKAMEDQIKNQMLNKLPEELKELFLKALNEQHNKTKEACARACLCDEGMPNYIVHKAFHNMCLNVDFN